MSPGSSWYLSERGKRNASAVKDLLVLIVSTVVIGIFGLKYLGVSNMLG